jgi:hypothetical protein
MCTVICDGTAVHAGIRAPRPAIERPQPGSHPTGGPAWKGAGLFARAWRPSARAHDRAGWWPIRRWRAMDCLPVDLLSPRSCAVSPVPPALPGDARSSAPSRPPDRVEGHVMPASENLHKCLRRFLAQVAASISLDSTEIGAHIKPLGYPIPFLDWDPFERPVPSSCAEGKPLTARNIIWVWQQCQKKTMQPWRPPDGHQFATSHQRCAHTEE